MGPVLMQMPIVINESDDEGRTGAVDVFASLSDAEGYIEPWFAQVRHWAYDARGQPLKIRADGNRTIITVDASRPPIPETLRRVLIGFLSSLPSEGLTTLELANIPLEDLTKRAAAHPTR